MLEFVCVFVYTRKCINISFRVTLSIRDVLTWVEFINLSQIQIYKESMSAAEAYLHGAFLAIIDGIGSGKYYIFFYVLFQLTLFKERFYFLQKEKNNNLRLRLIFFFFFSLPS